MGVILHRHLPDDARFFGIFNVGDSTDFIAIGIENAKLGLLKLAAAQARGDALLPAVHTRVFAPPIAAHGLANRVFNIIVRGQDFKHGSAFARAHVHP